MYGVDFDEIRAQELLQAVKRIDEAMRQREQIEKVLYLLDEARVQYTRYGRPVELTSKKSAIRDGYLNLDIDKSELPKLYKAIGSVRVCDKRVDDAKKKTVWVAIRSVNFPEVSFEYLDTLKRGSKCKIKKVRHRAQKAYSTVELVCETGN